MCEPAEQGGEDVSRPIAEANGETRCYYFSPETVRHERELLRRYHAEDFRGLLTETHMLLVGLVKVMKSTHHYPKIKPSRVSRKGFIFMERETGFEPATFSLGS